MLDNQHRNGEMGAIKLELRYPQNVNGISVDPRPDWSFDDLMSQLNTLEKKLGSPSLGPKTRMREIPTREVNTFQKKLGTPSLGPKTRLRDISPGGGIERTQRPFVMHISEDELGFSESDGEEGEGKELVLGSRFSCSDLGLSDSDDSKEDLSIEIQSSLMDKVGLEEGALIELTHEHQHEVKEEIRSQVSALEIDLQKEIEISAAALLRIEKEAEARRELDKKLDTQYRRKIAEALDNHLTAVQRDHEHRSQIEERKIRNEEKLQQEKARHEAAKKRAEEAKAAALEAERRAAKEAAEREAVEASEREAAAAAAAAAQKEAAEKQVVASSSVPSKKIQSPGSIIRSSDAALKLEEERLQKYKEFNEENMRLGLRHEDYQSYERQIARLIRQISGTKENVRAKATELVKIFNNPACPKSISVAMFAKKVISQCETPSSSFTRAAFACGHVIVLVASQVPYALDLLLAEFHLACIYTVPKHVQYSESVFETKEAYYRAIGIREEDGKIESVDRYLERLESYVRLYAAIIQTEAGVQNAHGLKEGWAWIARLLNALPANKYTAVALEAFLSMAGFSLYKRYRSQFQKILDVIYTHFLVALRAQTDPKVNKTIMRIQTYIEGKQFLKEPEGWRLQSSLLSGEFVPEEESYYPSNKYYYQW
ncbi:mRNA export factor GLE1-like [Dillenia turbinata]|uniref:mRNA export factor GLE1 n=1 Tax=Dillenia turbinata TaxID=194707 RepID=A0AAN8Z2L2_9MAGN